MANIGIFATPESEEALQTYMGLFSTNAEIYTADLAYDNYEFALQAGQVKVTEFLQEHNLEPQDVMIVFITVAGMRWNLLDKENTNEPTRHPKSGSDQS